jgi:hypothetical protein
MLPSFDTNQNNNYYNISLNNKKYKKISLKTGKKKEKKKEGIIRIIIRKDSNKED